VSPKQAYALHRSQAAGRGVEFDLTFDEWWEIWEPRWHLRGVRADQMQMCRTRDQGGYTPGNVRIDTQRANAVERGVSVRVKRAASAFLPKTGGRQDQPASEWCWRADVFKPYEETEEDS
jgi:hypothetical protein